MNCWLHTEHLSFKPVIEGQFFFSLRIFNKKIHSNIKTKELLQFPDSLWLKVGFCRLRCTWALTVHISFGSNRAHGWKCSAMHKYRLYCIQVIKRKYECVTVLIADRKQNVTVLTADKNWMQLYLLLMPSTTANCSAPCKHNLFCSGHILRIPKY
jgi:hypothetical protein